MVFAAEYTATTLVAWGIVALVVGFSVGWILRPWLVADRLRQQYEGRLDDVQRLLDAATASLEAATAARAATKADLDSSRADHARARADLAAASARARELEDQIAALATEKDAEIARLSAEAGKVGGLEVAVAERDSQIAVTRCEARRVRRPDGRGLRPPR